jgi:hypothetical protein
VQFEVSLKLVSELNPSAVELQVTNKVTEIAFIKIDWFGWVLHGNGSVGFYMVLVRLSSVGSDVIRLDVPHHCLLALLCLLYV